MPTGTRELRLGRLPTVMSGLLDEVVRVLAVERLGVPVALVPVTDASAPEALANATAHAVVDMWEKSSAWALAPYLAAGMLERGGPLGVVARRGWYVCGQAEEAVDLAGMSNASADQFFARMHRTLVSPSGMTTRDSAIVARNGYNVTVRYVEGEDGLVAALRNASHAAVVSLWSPHWLEASLDLARVSLAPYTAACYSGAAADVYCDYPAEPLSRFFWPGLKVRCPSAHALLKSIALNTSSLTDLYALWTAEGTVEAAACAWLRANTALWEPWFPAEAAARRTSVLVYVAVMAAPIVVLAAASAVVAYRRWLRVAPEAPRPSEWNNNAVFAQREWSGDDGLLSSSYFNRMGHVVNFADLKMVYPPVETRTACVINKATLHNQTVGVKTFLFTGNVTGETLARQFHHPNIANFLGASIVPPLALVFEYPENETLLAVILRQPEKVDARFRLSAATGIAQAMQYLHSQIPPVVHASLQSKNVLVDRHMCVRVVDFGVTHPGELQGTGDDDDVRYQAPEVAADPDGPEATSPAPPDRFTTRSDVYSYGVVLWELHSLRTPYWQLASASDVARSVRSGKTPSPVPLETPAEALRVMLRCWDMSPAKRPSFYDIVRMLADDGGGSDSDRSSGQ
eukprot:m51a1_g4675 putative fibroblast growth factor receptor (629) ;mRNA; f:133735-136328